MATEERPPVGSDPGEKAEWSDVRRKIEQEIRRLPAPLRSVVILREIVGLKYEEIADALGIPLNSVRVYLYRGRRMLREKLRYLLEES
jgi:RNA polymerase sigma-70 factor (ECF subfamily)